MNQDHAQNHEQARPERVTRLPYSKWWPIVAGALCGVVMRLAFSGHSIFPFDVMGSAFIGFTPLAVGAVTVYVAERSGRCSWGYCAWAAAAANALFVASTLAIMVEGLICAILIVPLFAVYGMLGGLLMSAICRVSNWPRTPTVYGFALLPVLLAVTTPQHAAAPYFGAMERSVDVAADAATIWRQLHDTRDIQASEVDAAWMYRIGVPLPTSGITHATPAGLVREVRMGKGIHFSQLATEWQDQRYVRWTYRFADDSFPAGALDEHVKIGGEHFDVIDTAYLLTPLADGGTRLTIRMHYRVSTQFNWYAKRIASGLIGNFEESILQLYAARAERAAGVHAAVAAK